MKYQESDFDTLFKRVSELDTKVTAMSDYLDSFPDLDYLQKQLDAMPDFINRAPIIEVHPDLKKIDRLRAAIIELYYSGGCREVFSTQLLKGIMKTTCYNNMLYKLVGSGEIIKLESRTYQITDKFKELYLIGERNENDQRAV